jgi:ABC-2 type transport system ATP-binding protein
VVLDEPTVGLEPSQIREIRHLIRELGGSHSVILSTHILPEVQATCDRVQIINKGKLVLSDSIEGMTRHMQTSSLLLKLRNAPSVEIIGRIAGIESVEPCGDGRLRVRHSPESNPAEALADAAVRGGWGLQELVPERRTLEEIFVDITTHETTQETMQATTEEQAA